MDFFGDLGRKFSHAARAVTERTRESVENTKLSVDLRAARAELESRLADLGRAYYDSVVVEGCPVPESLLLRVRESMAQVEALEGQRDRANRQCRCPACGSVQGAEARFCSNCGRPMPEAAPAEPEIEDDEEFCESCGAVRQGESRYCAVCGAAFARGGEMLPVKAEEPAQPKPEAPEEPDYTEAE